jgi:hypothetical protein
MLLLLLMQVEDEHEARHTPAGTDSGPGYLLQVISRFDLAHLL